MPTSYKVQLFRYDLTQGMAAQFSTMMLGIHVEAVWHTAIHVYGREFYFDGGVGIVEMAPGTTRFGNPMRIDDLGETQVPPETFYDWNVAQMRSKFGPSDYSLLSRNCNHYTQDAAVFLTGRGIGEDIVGMIDRLLSTPLGQMLRPNLEILEQGGGGGGGLQPLPITSQLRPTATASPTASTVAAASSQAALSVPLGTHPITDDEQDALTLALSLLESDDDSKEALEQATGTLLTIIGNILDAPTEPKFRRIGMHTNAFQGKLRPLPSALEVLRVAGFVEVADKTQPADKMAYLELTSKTANAAVLRRLRDGLRKLHDAVLADLGRAPQVVEWVPWRGGTPLPPNALRAGREGNGQLLYVGRDRRDGALGKCAPHLNGCNVPRNGGEAPTPECDVLCVRAENEAKVQWLPRAAFTSVAEIFEVSVVSGACVRGSEGDGLHPGWWPAGSATPLIPYGGQAADASRWQMLEVLCRTDKLTPELLARAAAVRDAQAQLAEHYADCCAPIGTIKELWAWTPPSSRSVPPPPALVPREKRPSSRASAAAGTTPQVLVCHDYKGGFHKDNDAACFNGGRGCARCDEGAYYAGYWHMIDIFCYFSHCRVTIPPREWIAAAHRNGVKIIGTFITEWEQGTKECELFLATPGAIDRTVAQLVALATHFGFDGWLVNIENNLPQHLTPAMVRFVDSLTKATRAALGPAAAFTVWYDAMTIQGRLAWQNMLSELNKPFFDVADALFINYKWSPEHLRRSMQLLAGSGPAAARSKTDIFVGCDVFGRGTFGGGGLQTATAFVEIFEHGLSAALFAPGWTRESSSGSGEFLAKDRAFWGSLEGFCDAREEVRALPFATCFHGPVGSSCAINGEPQLAAAGGGAYAQLGAAQPFSSHLATSVNAVDSNVESEKFSAHERRVVAHDAFHGNQSLGVRAKWSPAGSNGRWALIPLLDMHVEDAANAGQPIIVQVTMKCGHQHHQHHGLVLRTVNVAGGEKWFTLDTRHATAQEATGSEVQPLADRDIIGAHSKSVVGKWTTFTWIIPATAATAGLRGLYLVDGDWVSWATGGAAQLSLDAQEVLQAADAASSEVLIGRVAIMRDSEQQHGQQAVDFSGVVAKVNVVDAFTRQHLLEVRGLKGGARVGLFYEAGPAVPPVFLGFHDVSSEALLRVPFSTTDEAAATATATLRIVAFNGALEVVASHEVPVR